VSGGGWGNVHRQLRAKGVLPKKRTSNQHSDLCARRGGKTQPCTCGAAERSKALERELLRTLTLAGIPPDRSDLVDGSRATFLPDRLFRGDAIYDRARLVVEVQGWAGGYGPHGGIAKAKADVEKHQLAAAHGWRILPVTAEDIRAGRHVRLVLGALAWRAEYGRIPPAGPAPAPDADLRLRAGDASPPVRVSRVEAGPGRTS
jgi:hypothetical protein